MFRVCDVDLKTPGNWNSGALEKAWLWKFRTRSLDPPQGKFDQIRVNSTKK